MATLHSDMFAQKEHLDPQAVVRKEKRNLTLIISECVRKIQCLVEENRATRDTVDSASIWEAAEDPPEELLACLDQLNGLWGKVVVLGGKEAITERMLTLGVGHTVMGAIQQWPRSAQLFERCAMLLLPLASDSMKAKQAFIDHKRYLNLHLPDNQRVMLLNQDQHQKFPLCSESLLFPMARVRSCLHHAHPLSHRC